MVAVVVFAKQFVPLLVSVACIASFSSTSRPLLQTKTLKALREKHGIKQGSFERKKCT